ncbi:MULTISPECIES: efflux RND transporter periplasmic adaptor subunit [Sphingomonas]|uniref:efflux RND transporter periplasmic adaptor subunit n=1 Tax=Sphingomonas TaxID=13687 RepID=UPI000DEEBFE5|nr:MULTISPECIES: efflux RND transporter periplasmic adaptor subunit [Sphingomonas]
MPEPGNQRSLKVAGIVAAVVALGIAGAGIASRQHNEHELARETAVGSVPVVSVIHAAAATANGELTLPATLQALNSAPIYARTSGYVRKWFVDIGSPVHAGQVLAVLDAPEVDQQLVAAEADLQTARANQQLAATTAARWRSMLAKDAVSKQETDEKVGDYAAKAAVTRAAAANVNRLRFTQGFTRLVAPFGGIVTTRSTEIGQLVTAGSAGAAPLFTVADVSRMRVFVHVPQSYSAQVHPGMHVALTLPEYAGRTFDATLVRSAGAVDPSSGTVLVELQAPNGGRELKPGAYAQASFSLPGTASAVSLPASALITNNKGTQVATVGPNGHAVLKNVTLGRDLGSTVEVTAGLSASDRVIDSPPDSLQNGDPVQVQAGARAGR